MRLIDADALIDELNSRIEAAIKWGVNAIADRDAEIKLRAEQAVATFCEASLTAKKMPTIDPAKKGKWIKLDGSLWNMANCSECGEMCVLGDTAKFCPFCGASMVGVITEKRGRREMSDLISRQDAIDAINTHFGFNIDEEYGSAVQEVINGLPSAQPETAKRIVGKSRDGMTLWYQCDMCKEPVDVHDDYCRGCGRRLTDG